MKNILKNKYGIEISDFEEYDDAISFIVDGTLFYFKKTVYDEVYLRELQQWQIWLNGSVSLHDFVFNKDGNLLSDGYVLFKCNVLNDNVNLNDVILFNNIRNLEKKKYFINMVDFWESKIDYLERQLSEFSYSALINNSFDYYVGIAEQLLSYLKKQQYDKNADLCLSHRVFNSLSSLEFYCPLNVCIDYSVRDLALYIRNTNDVNLLMELVDKIIDVDEKAYFFVRMAFPFSYFTELSNVLIEKKDEKKLINIVNNVNQYEKYLSFLEEQFNNKLFYWIKKE